MPDLIEALIILSNLILQNFLLCTLKLHISFVPINKLLQINATFINNLKRSLILPQGIIIIFLLIYILLIILISLIRIYRTSNYRSIIILNLWHLMRQLILAIIVLDEFWGNSLLKVLCVALFVVVENWLVLIFILDWRRLVKSTFETSWVGFG